MIKLINWLKRLFNPPRQERRKKIRQYIKPASLRYVIHAPRKHPGRVDGYSVFDTIGQRDIKGGLQKDTAIELAATLNGKQRNPGSK